MFTKRQKEQLEECSILLCGGVGYIGDYLVDLLQEKLGGVLVYDICMFEERYLKPIPFINGDVRDEKKLFEVLKLMQPDAVVYLAGLVGDGACSIDPFLTKEINTNAVKWMTDNYDGKLIFPSTCSVYGINNDLIDETAKTNPISVYAETKLEAEQYILNNSSDPLVFRLGTVYGIGGFHSRIRLDLVVNILTKLAVEGKTLQVFGGAQYRPVVHVKDVGEAMFYGLKHGLLGLYNLSSSNFTIAKLAEKVVSVVGKGEVEYQELPFEDLRNYRVKNDKLLSTGWQPQWSLEEGIKQIADVVSENRIKDLSSPVYSNVGYLNEHYWRIDQ